jgi:hypothetical protein
MGEGKDSRRQGLQLSLLDPGTRDEKRPGLGATGGRDQVIEVVKMITSINIDERTIKIRLLTAERRPTKAGRSSA